MASGRTRSNSYRALIESALRAARMENASFGPMPMTEPIVLGTPEEVDRFVKEAVRLYIDTWVCGPLERALAKVVKKRVSADR